MRLPALRATLRIARRDALRSPGRSILVVAMLALPILGLTAADVLARSAQLSPAEEARKLMGSSDAVLTWFGGIGQGPAADRPPTTAEVTQALPAGSQVLSKTSIRATFGTPDGAKLADLIGFDFAAPPVRGMVRQVSGRAPTSGAEIALTPALARATGAGLGDSVRINRPEAESFRVVGIAEDPYELDLSAGYTLPAGLPSVQPGGPGHQSWYVTTVRPLDRQHADALSAQGYGVTSRADLLHPTQDQSRGAQSGEAQAVTALALAVGMALLEVVLLAGPAFAVGARRRRRELALVAATGGDRRDVRNIVLAGGLVLGVTGAIIGVAAGLGLAAAVLPLLERLTNSTAGRFDVRPAELAGVALLGVLTGLAAAYLPARSAARQDVVTALAGRRGAVRTKAWTPVLGVVLVLAGTAIAIGGAVVTREIVIVLAGAVIGELGAILCTPALLGLAGHLGRRLPLSPRMALRDASRNRSSAAPAIAAVMAAVAGSVGIGIFVASQAAHDRDAYRPGLPHSDAAAQLESESSSALAPQVAAALQRTLPTHDVVVISGLPIACVNCPSVQAVSPESCPAARTPEAPCVADSRSDRHPYLLPSVQVDDGGDVPRLAGVPGTAAVAALRAGNAVVFDPALVKNGKTVLTIWRDDKETRPQVPAVAFTEGTAYAQVILPPQLARSLGLPFRPATVYADNRSMPTEAQQQAAQGAMDELGIEYLDVERGYVDDYGIGLIALLVGAAIITLGAAGIATALSNADGRQDLATLAAVGASPRVRRSLSMSRAGVIAGLGTGLGTVVGFLPPVGLILVLQSTPRDPLNSPADSAALPLVIPWSYLGVTALVVPVIAVLVAGLFSRSRLPVERRPAT